MGEKKEARRSYNYPPPGVIPAGPDPGKQGAKLLAKIQKHGGLLRYSECEIFCEDNGLNLEGCLKNWGASYIMKGRYGKEEYVKIMNKPWATQWQKYHLKELAPHHRHEVHTFGRYEP